MVKIEHITFLMTWVWVKPTKTDQKLNKNIDIYYIGYITTKEPDDV